MNGGGCVPKNSTSLIAFILSVVLCAGVLVYLAIENRPAEPIAIIYEQPVGEQPEQESAEPLRIDLNTATGDELQMLPDIGPHLAQQIIAYRQSIGKFETVEQIMEVSGIGEKRFAAIRDMITVGGTP